MNRLFLPRIVLMLGLLMSMSWSLSSCKTAQTTAQKTDSQDDSWENAPQIPSQDLLFETQKPEPSAPIWVIEKGDYHPEESKPFDLVHTLLKVSFDWEKQWMNGEASLTMTPHFYPQQQIVLDAKSFAIHEVKVQKKDGQDISSRFSYDSLLLSIDLSSQVSRGDTLAVHIRYTAKPNERVAGGSAAISSDKGLYFINPQRAIDWQPRQIWTQGETEASSCWFPTFDSPNVKTSQEIHITVNDSLTTLSNGRLVSSQKHTDGTRTDHWRQDQVHTPYLFMMAIGEYAKVEDRWNDIPVDYYVEPKYAQYAKDVFGNTPEMMTFFSKKFGIEYPWDKYAQVVVRDYVSGAMENTSASLFHEGLQCDKRSLLDENHDNIIAHELSHHWFGDLVTCESWANLPLNESFANYAEYLWQEYKNGEAAASLFWLDEQQQYMQESSLKRVPMIRYHYQDKEDMFDRHSYSKGCLVLHLLRSQVGDEAFFAALQEYLSTNAYQAAEIDHLRLAFEKITGKDMHWFFDQFFMQPGHPEMLIKHSYDQASQSITMRVFQLQDPSYTPIYQIPVKVRYWINGQSFTQVIQLSQADEKFTWKVDSKPSAIIFDADASLFGKVEHLRSLEELIAQYQISDRFLDKYLALQSIQSDVQTPWIKDIFVEALSAPESAFRLMALEALSNYASPSTPDWMSQIRDLAFHDPVSEVRAYALASMAGTKKADQELLNRALGDSSYIVVSVALWFYPYLHGGIDGLPETLAKYEPYHQADLATSIGEIYLEIEAPNKTDWFIEKMKNMGGWSLLSFMRTMSSYLDKQPLEEQKKAVSPLAKLAQHSGNSQIRISAFRMLNQVNKVEGVNELMKQITEAESDPKLKKEMQAYD